MLLGYPAWVLTYKGEGKEIRRIKGNYYLYQVRCVWNKERKRPQKITEAFLGRITEIGLVKKDRSEMQSTTMSVSNKRVIIPKGIIRHKCHCFIFLQPKLNCQPFIA